MNKITRENKGITLIALIVTIIVLLILAGIAITLTVGNNGLFTRARDSKKLHEIGEILEKLEIEKSHIQIDENGNTSIGKYLDHIIEEGIISELDIEDTDADDNKSKYITVDDKYVFLVEEEEDGNIKITYEGEIGKSAPKLKINITSITSSTITVKTTASMMKEGEYEYYIKEEETGEEYKLKKTGGEKEYRFEELKPNTDYRIKVVAKNKAGSVEKESGIIKTIELADLAKGGITFEYNPEGWTNKNVTVIGKVEKEVPNGAVLQTSKNAKDWEDTEKQEFETNGEMYVRIYDGVNESSYAIAQVNKIDKEKPKITEITPSNYTLLIKGTDTLSGITGYVVSKESNAPTIESFTEVSNTKSLSITANKLSRNNQYYVWIKDEAGNISDVKPIKTTDEKEFSISFNNNDRLYMNDCYTKVQGTKTEEQNKMITTVQGLVGDSNILYPIKNSDNTWSIIGQSKTALSNYYLYDRYGVDTTIVYEEGEWSDWINNVSLLDLTGERILNNSQGWKNYSFSSSTGKFSVSGYKTLNTGAFYYHSLGASSVTKQIGDTLREFKFVAWGSGTSPTKVNYRTKSALLKEQNTVTSLEEQVLARNGTYPDNDLVSVGEHSYKKYVKGAQLKQYNIYKYKDNKIQAVINAETRTIITRRIDLPENNGTVKIYMRVLGQWPTVSISNDMKTWKQVLGGQLNGTTAISLGEPWDCIYIKIDGGVVYQVDVM